MLSNLNAAPIPTHNLSRLLPIFVSSFGLGIAFGGYIPLLALWLESIGVSFALIGLIAGAGSIGVIISAYIGPQVVKYVGYLKAAIFGIFLASLAGVLFRLCNNEFLWLMLRIIAGLGFGLHWVISEAWLGHLVTDKNRTRAMSFYVISMALGFTIGPIIIWFSGVSAIAPFIIISLIQAFSVLPLILLWQVQPSHSNEAPHSPFFLLKAGPKIAAGCILVGIIDLSIISLIPALVQKTPSSVLYLAFLLPIVGALGNVVIQYPLAVFSEKVGNNKTGYCVVIFGSSLCALLPFFLNSTIISVVLAFFGSGIIYFMYTLSLSMLSKQFKGAKLISANASFVMLFEISSLIGPLIAGILLDKFLNIGLSAFLISVGFAYLLVTVIKDLQKQRIQKKTTAKGIKKSKN